MFENACKNKELFEFAIGHGHYFVLDREFGEHWISGSWEKYILPFLKDHEESHCIYCIVHLFLSIMDTELLSPNLKEIVYYIICILITMKLPKVALKWTY